MLHNQYGIASHITWPDYDYDDYRGNIALIRRGGYGIIRTDFGSNSIGWNNGTPDFTIWDIVSEESIRNGIQLLPIVYTDILREYTKGYSRDYKGFVRECALRYKSTVVGWEIWNEMDQFYANEGTIPAKEYVRLLSDAFKTIKEIDSNVPVLLGAIGDIGTQYFTDLLKLGSADYFDILSIHYYSAKGNPEGIVSYYHRLNDICNKYKVDKSVWLTETGYTTTSDFSNPEVFYTDVLPKVYKRLGINCSNSSLGVLYDKRINRSLVNQDNRAIYTGFRDCRLVYLDELSSLSVEDCPVIMILFGELFPKGYIETLETYVKKGGTVVFPEGGAPMYYDWDLDSEQVEGVGSMYYNQLHVSCMFPWEPQARKMGIKSLTKVTPTDERVYYSWAPNDLPSPKYLTDENLHKGDTFIPIIIGSDGNVSGTVAACYSLNSELKGNIIIQTRHNSSEKISENLQASRMPRLFLLSYAMGVDCVFPYCLRSRDNNYEYGIVDSHGIEKPAFSTIRALTEKLPEGSSRPLIIKNSHRYIASWKIPDGKIMYCVWSDIVGVNNNIRVTGRARYYNDKGERICKRSFHLTPEVTYIEGANSVAFVE